jgi:hypothetical protein
MSCLPEPIMLDFGTDVEAAEQFSSVYRVCGNLKGVEDFGVGRGLDSGRLV